MLLSLDAWARKVGSDGSEPTLSVDLASTESGLAATFPTKPIATITLERAAPARRKFEQEATAFGFERENLIILSASPGLDVRSGTWGADVHPTNK